MGSVTRLRLGMACLLILAVVVGCGKAEPKPTAPAAVSESIPDEVETDPPVQPEPLPVLLVSDTQPKDSATDEKAGTLDAEQSEEVEISPEREAELQAKLAKDPQNVEILLTLAAFAQVKADQAESGETDYGLIKKSAAYLRRALAADPKVVDQEQFQDIAPQVFYDEACALSQEKKIEAGLKSLNLAIEHGWSNLTAITLDADLANLRASKNFAVFLKSLRAKRRKLAAGTVQALFANQPDFDFEFDLKDSNRRPVTKQEFAGKLLMVNVWGTWCGPCKAEIPDLVAAYDKYQPQGFEIVGLNIEDEVGTAANARIKEHQKQLGINYRCALGNERVLQQIPGFNGTVPMSLFFDRQGKARVVLVGMVDEVLLEMIIERLLKESPAETAK